MEKAGFVRENGLWVHPDFVDLLRRHHLNHFNVLYHLKGGELFTKKRFCSVVRIYLRGSHGKAHIFHLKRHFSPLRERLRAIFTGFQIGDGAENEWKKMLRLQEMGIRTMTPVAFGAIRKMGLPYLSLTLTEQLYGADKLENYLPARFGQRRLRRDQIAQKRRIIAETARWGRRFHDSGLQHPHVSLGNIFIRPQGDDEFTLHLVDVQKVREPWSFRQSRKIKSLAQINFSARQLPCITNTDRLRFLHAYLKIDRLDGSSRKFIRRIASRTQRVAVRSEKMNAIRAREKLHYQRFGMIDRKKIKEPK